jgi:signal transduction histidine kinase
LLHPPDLEQVGLIEAIRGYIKGFSQRSGINVELELSPDLARMAPMIELTLFRVMQESLINIQRHSGSSRATIRIERKLDLMLEIRDYGSRLSSRAAIRFRPGVGISSMQERVKSIGGRFDVDARGEGTTVRVRIPLEQVPA